VSGDPVIPFNRPTAATNAARYISQALDSQKLSGNNEYGRACESLISKITGAPFAFVTPSCTDALEMSALLLRIEPGDEVIVPSFTFTSTATAFVLRGARIVFADSRIDTKNLDESQLESLISDRTRAIVVVHYGGVGCEMDGILEIARTHGIAVVEDNAHGLGGRYRGQSLGTFGTMATQSFHETKNVSCGEGGALLLNDELLVERAEIVREKGTNRSKFARGEVDKYTWVDDGSSFLPSELTSAMLLAGLEEFDRIQDRRRKIWDAYYSELAEWADRNRVELPVVPQHCDQAYHLFYLLLPNGEALVKLKPRSRASQSWRSPTTCLCTRRLVAGSWAVVIALSRRK